MNEKELLKELKKKNKEIESLRNQLEKLEKQYRKDVGKPSNEMVYVKEHYDEIFKLYFQLCAKWQCRIRNPKQSAKMIIALIEGDNERPSVFTSENLLKYLKLVDSFTVKEYQNIPYAPGIRNEYSFFENTKQRSKVLIEAYKQKNYKKIFSQSDDATFR